MNELTIKFSAPTSDERNQTSIPFYCISVTSDNEVTHQYGTSISLESLTNKTLSEDQIENISSHIKDAITSYLRSEFTKK